MSAVQTPGPWVANYEHHARDNDAQFMVCAAGDQPLACLSADGFIGIGERKANARLMAAAPELLKALKEMNRAYVNLLEAGRDRIIDFGGTCDAVDVMEANSPDLKAARDAIKKAEGA